MQDITRLRIEGNDIFNANWVKDRWEERRVSQKKLNHFYTNLIEEVWMKDMTTQRKLSSPRKGLTFEVKINNHAIFLRTGEYEDGTLGEIFIDMYKEGAGYKSILANFSITVSWLLQFGVPLEKLVNKFKHTRFDPSGMVVGDNEIKMCSSVFDYVFRRLGISYLDQKDLGNVQASELPDFVEDTVIPKKYFPIAEELEGVIAGVEIVRIQSGAIEIRFTGPSAAHFHNYCRKNGARENAMEGVTFQLDFSEEGLMIYDPHSQQEIIIKELKTLWREFYKNEPPPMENL